MRKWLRQHPQHIPAGMDVTLNNSHQLRNGLRRMGWSVQETPNEERLIMPGDHTRAATSSTILGEDGNQVSLGADAGFVPQEKNQLRSSFAGFDFVLVGAIQPECEPSGVIREFMPQSRYAKSDTIPLNPYGAGPFCSFSIAWNIKQPGVYVVTLEGTPVYAGKCDDLSKRWGGMGYGSISPKNCFIGGQSTNCKVNNHILKNSQAGQCIELWFHQTTATALVERAVVLKLNPLWNSQIPR